MGLPDFTAPAALERGSTMFTAPTLAYIAPGGWPCFTACMNSMSGGISGKDVEEAAIACALLCGIPYTPGIIAAWLAWARSVGLVGGGSAAGESAPGWLSRMLPWIWGILQRPIVTTGPAIGGPGALAGWVLVAIGAGTGAGWLIEHYGWLAKAWPGGRIPWPGCVPVGPDTQHSITVASHLGCARSESLARIAANDDCASRTGRCTGSCPSGTCQPYARVWDTATLTSGNVFGALYYGCETTAYYTCKCGC